MCDFFFHQFIELWISRWKRVRPRNFIIFVTFFFRKFHGWHQIDPWQNEENEYLNGQFFLSLLTSLLFLTICAIESRLARRRFETQKTTIKKKQRRKYRHWLLTKVRFLYVFFFFLILIVKAKLVDVPNFCIENKFP